jgi:RES domain-containing protein
MDNIPKNTTIHIVFPFKDLQVWQKFVVELKRENRFTLSDEPARFVELLIEYAKKHKSVKLSSGTPMFRARINEVAENYKPIAIENMGTPPIHLAGHGRLNPKGIPYLYLASDKLTAVSEVRPWVNCHITVAEFVLSADCNLINFSKVHMVNIPEGKEYEGSEFTWRELITWMFSAPFDPRDDTAYIPTQYIAERIKGAGFDGIIYDSALNAKGYNIALFNEKNVRGVRCEKALVTNIEVQADISAFEDSQS